MIRFENFSKSYRDFIAVKDVSFTVRAGRVTVMLGANGAGKTTLLRAVPAFHYATSGKVFVSAASGENVFFDKNTASDKNSFHGEHAVYDVNDNPAIAKQLVGYVPEIPVLYEDMDSAEFIATSALMHGVPKSQLQSAVLQALSRCALMQVADKKIKTLSKGYRQRVCLAAAIVYDPPNIVLDEPSSGLDPAQINHLRQTITELAKTKSVLLSTHIISEAVAIDAHIVIIAGKTVAVEGSAKDICDATNTSSLEEAYMYFAGDGV